MVHDVEGGRIVPDLDFVGVGSGEEEREVQCEERGLLGRRGRDEEVGDVNVVEVEGGLFGTDGEEDEEEYGE